MNQKKQQTRGRNGPKRMIAKAILRLGMGVLAILSPAAPAIAQVAPTAQVGPTPATQPAAAQAHNAPSARAHLITDGLSGDGKVALVANKSTVVTTARPYKSVSVGQPEVADVTPVSPTNILVTAKKPGTTQLIVWDDQNRTQVADVNVTMDLDALAGQLNSMFPGTRVEVSSLGGSIALRGRVPDIQTAEQAASAAGAYGVKVLNFLEVGGGQQVMLQVRFAEVSRTATSQLGVNFAMSDGIFSFGNNVGQVTPSGFAEGSPGQLATQSVGSGVTLFGSGQSGAVAFRYFISALRQNNLLRVLAEPNLIAMSGQEASFLAGGEFPVPVPQSGTGGAATITIEYREFGVRLGFVPIVLGDGRIRLKMTPEVSDLDFSSPIVISGSRIPIVNKRKVTTMVELGDGQTFAIAGLLNNNIAAAKDVTPVLGDLPVLGSLFRSVRYQRKETELVVLVTPKLVAPLNPAQVSKLPGEHWRHPNEAQLFLNQDIGGEMDVPVERMADTEPAGSADAAQENATPATAPSNPAMAGNATTQPAIAIATTRPAPAGATTTQPAIAVATTRPAPAGATTTQPALARTPTFVQYPAHATATTTQPGFAAPNASKPTLTIAATATTRPSNVSATATTQPSIATAASTKPSIALAPTAATRPSIVVGPAATTRPAMSVMAATPATQPAMAMATPATQPSRTVAMATPATQPSMIIAMATPATQPSRNVAMATPATQPAMAAPAVAMATTRPANMTGMAANSTTAQPANNSAASTAPSNNSAMTSAKSGSAGPVNNGNGPTQTAGGMRFTPRYHGRHGFTPPSHAPPRGQQ